MFAVTTSNAELWDLCGRTLARTHNEFWPNNAPLIVYSEGFDVDVPCTQRRLPDWFEAWKLRHAKNADAHGRNASRNRRRALPYDYRRDCVRFAHKVAALTDAGLRAEGGLMVWVDADILTHQPVDEEWIRGLLRGNYMAWLDRVRLYPECGFVIFDCDHPHHRDFMELYRDYYLSDRVFSEAETHDSYVLQQLVNVAVGLGWFSEPTSLSRSARRQHHPLPFSPLGARLDHAKGPRKNLGRTPKHEVRIRSEPHWK